MKGNRRIRVDGHCASCLYDRQKHVKDDPEYLAEVRRLIDGRRPGDTAPYLVYLFGLEYERRFGRGQPYEEVKKRYNDFVLGMEDAVRARIEAAPDPCEAALMYARTGNYIDFGAMDDVDESEFLRLFDGARVSESDRPAVDSFFARCASAKTFLLIADNCGEIVLDRLFVEQLKKRYPGLSVSVMVRGGEVLNDATAEDALYAGFPESEIVSSGNPVGGVALDMLSDEARRALDGADVILAKGQGNYESLNGRGRHVFYSLLCKCAVFTEHFGVAPFTGMFIEEG